MPYEVGSPIGAAFGAAAGYMQGQQAQADRKRQQQQDDEAAHSQAALNAATEAYRTSQMDAENRRLGIEEAAGARSSSAFAATQRAKGLDADGNPLPDPYTPPKNGGKKPDLRAQAAIAYAHAEALRKAGQGDTAKFYMDEASKLQTGAAAAERNAAAFQRTAIERIRITAEIQHWTTQDMERATHDANTLALGIRNGDIRHSDAMASIGVRLQGIGQAHADRLAGRTDADRRFAESQRNANARFGIAQKNIQGRFKESGKRLKYSQGEQNYRGGESETEPSYDDGESP